MKPIACLLEDIVDLRFDGDLWLDPSLTQNQYTVTGFENNHRKYL